MSLGNGEIKSSLRAFVRKPGCRTYEDSRHAPLLSQRRSRTGGQMTDFEHPTLLLKKSEVTLLQALGRATQQGASLLVYSGDDTGTRFALDQPEMVIGRAPDAQVWVDTVGVSRRHAVLEVDDSGAWLRDLDSVNGTFVNERQLTAPVLLQDGDLIRVGKLVLKYFGPGSLEALLHDQFYRMATVDTDTGAFCKRYLLRTLDIAVRHACSTGRPLSVLCLDLDHFKAVNDRYGHNMGDQVLRGTATALQAAVRPGDVFGRMGGEEFAVVLPDTALDEAVALAERCRAAVEHAVLELPLQQSDGLHCVLHRQTASLGVAQWCASMDGARSLLTAADDKLYAAKRAGRNRIEY
jgi:diguanylate cyclase (GGDEF)-like protein